MDTKETIASLRRLADLLEVNSSRAQWFSASIYFGGYEYVADLLQDVKGYGRTEKRAYDNTFLLETSWPGSIEIKWITNRDNVCKRVVTEVVIPAKPEYVIAAQPEKTIEKVEWICPPSLHELHELDKENEEHSNAIV